MIEFYYTDTYTCVKCNLIERREIKRLLSAKPDGYRFSPKFKRKLWDGNIALLDKSNNFPSGLLNYVAMNLDDLGYDYDVHDYELDADHHADYIIPGYDIRDYQLDAVKQALSRQRGVLKMATNAGKTLIAAMIIKATGCKAVIVVPTQTLLTQTADDLESMIAIPVGRYGAGYHEKCDVTVTTMASLASLAKLDLSANRVIILDETHHGSAAQVFDNVFHVPGKYRLGMSGTPLTYERLADMKLVGVTGDVIYEVRNNQLIEGGFSTKPLIKFYKLVEPKILSKTKYHDAYQQGVVGNLIRNSWITKTAEQERQRGPVLILCNWVEHVDNITSLNPTFLHATGATPKSELDRLLASFDNSNDVLVASPIFGEGVNLPSVATVIMASGNKSHIQILQRIGRGLRRAEGKDVVHVYDFLDATHKYLLKHSEQRYKLYKDEGFEVTLITS